MPARELDVVLLPLTRDGRLVNPVAVETLHARLVDATDCFLFCHGWVADEEESRAGATRFFTQLDGALRLLGDRVRPLRAAVHWPSTPFAARAGSARAAPDELQPELLAGLSPIVRGRPRLTDQVLGCLLEAEVPLSPEEELELDALLRRVRDATGRGGAILSPIHALSFWLMKRRAGQVGERLGREVLAPVLGAFGERAPRAHLIGHSFGAKLLASAVLAGVRAESLVLLQAAFSAFAFADAVPNKPRPGFYRPVIVERRVAGPIVAVRSVHDRALGTLYPAVTGGGRVDRLRAPARNAATRSAGRHGAQDVVAGSAMGAVGARGTGAPDLDLITVQTTGVPRYAVVNIDASRVVTKTEWLIGAHRDIHHPEIATLVLMAAGLLQGSPTGARPRPLSPLRVL